MLKAKIKMLNAQITNNDDIIKIAQESSRHIKVQLRRLNRMQEIYDKEVADTQIIEPEVHNTVQNEILLTETV